jgi:hypothetical protein
MAHMHRASITLTVVLLLELSIAFAAEDSALARMMALNTEDALFSRLKALSGPKATACGTVKLREDDFPAFECARKALKDGRPFWVAIEVHGNDPTLWKGVAVEPDKTAWLVSYERRKSWEASLDQKLCHSPQFSPGQMTCAP